MENSATINLDESNFDREINTDKPVLVDFWAEWCGPCKLIAPLLDEIAREKADAVTVAKVNVDQNQSLSFKYNIRAIPSLLFFKNGQLRDQVTGMLVEGGEPKAVALAITRLLRDPDIIGRMGQAGRRRIEAEFSWEGRTRQLADILAGAVA